VQPSNILFIMSDEHNPKMLGGAGNPMVRTPHLDALAARGTRFTCAYTNSPICVPARASFATGRYVHDIGYWDNAIAYDGRVPGWGHRLQATGHRVEAIGKLHYRNAEDPTGFDRQTEPMHIKDGIGQVWGSIRDPLPVKDGAQQMLTEIGPGESGYNRYDMRIADRACAWLHDQAPQPGHRPWVLYLGFVAPHFPLVVPQEYFDLYPLDRIEMPKLLPRDGYRHHPWIRAMDDFQHVDREFDDDTRRRAIAAYFGLCTFVDAQIGRVLAALAATGLEATTRVIYSSDHGDNVGARGLWGKSNLYEEAAGIPMIVAGPDVPAGRLATTPVTLVDAYQTILHGVGLAREAWQADGLPGQSMLELATAPDRPERIAFSEYHAVGAASGAFMLRKGRYKLIHYSGMRPELFDLEADPEETTDLADDPAHGAALADLDAELRMIVDPDDANRRALADQAALIERFGGREAALGQGTPGATPAPE
jgi:choline-sulfatase